jgi:hypothetical protein
MQMLRRAAEFSLLLFLAAAYARAQTTTPPSPPMVMSAHTLIQTIQEHGTSGTSIEPATTPIPMLMKDHGA